MNTKNVSTDTAGPNLASIVGVKESLVTIDVNGVAVKKNEVGHILLGKERLKADPMGRRPCLCGEKYTAYT